jgi:hypothetical protein
VDSLGLAGLPGLLPSLVVATGPIAYVRFHGRNAAEWYQHEQAWERYNYTIAPRSSKNGSLSCTNLRGRRPHAGLLQ